MTPPTPVALPETHGVDEIDILTAGSRTAPLLRQARPWWAAVLESVVGLAAIGGLELALWRSGEIATIELHLFWVFVLLQALRHGLRLGLVVAFMAAGAYTCIAIGLPGSVDSSYERLATESIFVVLVAMITGDLREQWRGREKRLVAHDTELSDALIDLSQRYASASEVVAELGNRIAEQTLTVVTFDAIARHLQALDPVAVFPATLQLLALSLKAERVSVYMLEDGFLVSKAHLPASEPAPASHDMMDNDLVCQALLSGEACHVLEEPARASTAMVLMVAPLLDAQGEAIGVVTVEQMPFHSFNRTAVRLFGILVEWASRSLQNAVLYEQALARGAQPERASVLTFPQPAPTELLSQGSGNRADTDGARRAVAAMATRP